MPLKWIPRSKSGTSKSRPRWAAHTRIGNVWEYPPRAVPLVVEIYPGLQAACKPGHKCTNINFWNYLNKL